MKNPLLKSVHVIFFVLLISSLQIPLVFAKTKPVINAQTARFIPVSNEKPSEISYSKIIYDSLQLKGLGLSEQAFNYAVKGYSYLKGNGKILNDQILSIVDFTKPSYLKRLFVIDIQHCKLLFNTYVAHGQGSGKEFAHKFSNIPESYQSSLGFYLTTDTYSGKNGYSMHLDGLEKGINDKADDRAIVMHGAPYVSESFIRAQGYIGRSWGCPAVPEKLNKPIIEKIKNGTCLFIYAESNNYLKRSRIINS